MVILKLRDETERAGYMAVTMRNGAATSCYGVLYGNWNFS